MKACEHCGGEVGDDGYAMNLAELEQHQPIEGDETEQQASTESMRDEAFANAVKRVSHGAKKMAEGGMVESMKELNDSFKSDKQSMPFDSSERPSAEAEELRKRKAEKYGFPARRKD